MKKICFIILHYNTFNETCLCVDSILSLDGQECIEIIIIDNASKNDSYQELQKKYRHEKILFLKNKENLGFSRANNYAYNYARQLFSLEFVIFANNDICFLQKDFITRVRNEYNHSHFALLGPDVYTPRIDQHVSPISRQMIMDKKQLRKKILKSKIMLTFFPLYYLYWSYLNKHGKIKELAYDVSLEYQENVLLSGSCIICSPELLKDKTNIFYPETYFYYEEYILAYWCHLHQKKIVFQPSLQIIHLGGIATKTISGNSKSKLKFILQNDASSAKIYLQLLEGNLPNIDF